MVCDSQPQLDKNLDLVDRKVVFTQLKENYLYREARRLFLEAALTLDTPGASSDADLAASKAELESAQETTDAMSSAVLKKCAELHKALQRFENTRLDGMRRTQALEAVLGQENQSRVNQAKLFSARQRRDEIKGAISVKRARLSEPQAEPEEERMQQLQVMLGWTQEMSKAMVSISGVELGHFDSSKTWDIVLRPPVPVKEEHKVTFEFEGNTTVLRRVSINPESALNQDPRALQAIEDAQGTKNFRRLIKTLMLCRTEKLLMQLDLDALEAVYPAYLFDEKDKSVIVTLNSGVVITLQLSERFMER